jgi:hypothetical protein
MSELVMNYTVNPILVAFKKIGAKIISTANTLGRARAAAELARMGYHKEAREIMLKK